MWYVYRKEAVNMNIAFLENLCLSELTLITTYVAPKAHYPMKNRGRASFGMLYTIEGHESYHFYDKTVIASPDTILFIPKNEAYRIELEDEVSNVVCVDFDIVGEADFRPFLVKLGKSNPMKNLFQNAEKEWKRRRAGFYASCKSFFYSVISQLLRQESHYLNTEGYRKIADSVDYLHKHYLESDFRLSLLAEMSNMSGRYYETLFYHEFHMTPKEYVLSLKLTLAKELLSHEKTSVTDVALALGYSDIYYFSKLFKAKTGYTPSQYKHRYHDG